MLVEMMIKGKTIDAIVDTSAYSIHMSKAMAKELGVKYQKCDGFVQSATHKASRIEGVARDMEVVTGTWHGKLDITFAPLEDRHLYLDVEFWDKKKAFLVPHQNMVCICNGPYPILVPVKRETNGAHAIFALRKLKDDGGTNTQAKLARRTRRGRRLD